MAVCVPLRPDFDASTLRLFAKRCSDTRQTRRLLALAAVYDGMNHSEAAKIGGMDRQTLRDWVHWFKRARMAPPTASATATTSPATMADRALMPRRRFTSTTGGIQAVTGAPHGLDGGAMERDVDLLAQRPDVHLDDVRVSLEVEVPHARHDRGLCDDLT